MRYVLIMLSLMVMFLLGACAEMPKQSNNRKSARHTKSMLARVTTYWAKGKGSDYWTRRHRAATKTKLKSGHCAVDPRKIPYGSQIVYPDGSADTAVDTGKDVRNRKAARLAGRTMMEKTAIVVDKFFETKGEALRWASAHPMFIPIQIIPPVMRLDQEEERKW